MTLKEMSTYWGVPFSNVHSAACEVFGGKLPRGRRKWTREQEDAIKAIVCGGWTEIREYPDGTTAYIKHGGESSKVTI